MKCKTIIKYLEDWAPKEIAWGKDNVGLQIGTTEREIKNIMLSLDLDEKVVSQALKKNCNLLITHHPLLFKPLKKIDTYGDKISRLVESLIKNELTLYSAHTNLDYTKDGVSFQLAKRLNLHNIKFLNNLTENQVKIVVFVPEENLEKVAEVIHLAGGGVIGEYSNCSFRTAGTGTFKGSRASKPFTGKKEKLESTKEIKLEVIVDSWKIHKVIKEMISVHPYEEPAYDIYPLKNENTKYGIGAIGTLQSSMTKNEFLSHVSKQLKIKNFRYSNGKSGRINKVAVCGGSCSEHLEKAISIGADAFVTADLKYHSFQDAEDRILFIDAGHYETEIPVMDFVQKKLQGFLTKESRIKVFKYSGSTNPVNFYNN